MSGRNSDSEVRTLAGAEIYADRMVWEFGAIVDTIPNIRALLETPRTSQIVSQPNSQPAKDEKHN